MKRIMEQEIFAEVLNKEVISDRIIRIGYANGNGYGSYADSKEFIISHVNYYDCEEYIEKFRLTGAVKARWDSENIVFRVYVYIKDGKITGGHIFKYKKTLSGHFNSTGYEMEPTQQEIRIAKRILDYITKE